MTILAMEEKENWFKNSESETKRYEHSIVTLELEVSWLCHVPIQKTPSTVIYEFSHVTRMKS